MMIPLKVSYLWVVVVLFLLSSCVSSVKGRINSLANGTPKDKATFIVKQDNAYSLTQKHIKDLISIEMEKLGFTSASSQEDADYIVAYKFNVGSGVTNIASYPDFVVGGHGVSSVTLYPKNLWS